MGSVHFEIQLLGYFHITWKCLWLALISVMICFADPVHPINWYSSKIYESAWVVLGEFLKFNYWVTFIYFEKYSYLHHIGF